MATKIVYLADHYDWPHAGTEGQILQLIQNLDRSRYEPTLTLLRRSEYIERNGWPCPVEVLDIDRLASLRSLSRIVRYAARLRSEGCEIVHSFFNDASLTAPIFKAFGMRTVVSRRDMGFWYTPRILAALRLVAPFVDRYVANSQAVKGTVHRREWAAIKKISVIHNGYALRPEAGSGQTCAVSLLGVPDEAPVVGIVANLRPVKRVDTLIEALAAIHRHHPDVHAVIVGGEVDARTGASMQDKLSELAVRLGVAGKVVFTGQVPDATSYIDRFSVAVLCSESEGFSNSLIEYMQAGRPIVCTRTGGNPELIQDGHNGFLVPVGDAQALADRVAQLLSDSALARRLGQAARETVESAYSCTRLAAEQMSCYDQICLARRPAVPYRRAPDAVR